jgi:STE24 endopeptidase
MTSELSEKDLAPPLDLETAPPEVKRYQRQKLTAGIAALAITLAIIVAGAFWLGLWVDGLVRGFTDRFWPGNRWLHLAGIGFVYAAAVELLLLPLGFWSGFVVEHRHGLSKQSLARWAWQRIKGYLIGGPLGLIFLFGLYALLWYGGDWWWVWATVGWLAVTLVLGQLAPILILPLFYKVTPLDDEALLARLRRLADGTGLTVEGVYRLHLSAETRKANAALAGLGRTRRVLLGDTLLDKFTPEEIEVVFAHEVGHHVHRHLPKLIAGNVVLAAAGLALVHVVLHRMAAALGYQGYHDPAAFPLVLLVLVLFGLVLSPVQNAISRHFERQCDRYALERTGLVDAYRSAFIKLARLNKADPDPHPFVVWMFEDHPPIRERLRLAVDDKVTR